MTSSGESSDAKKALEAQACETAEQFVNIFYEKMDSKRHALGKHYLPSATVSWNGNKVEGAEEVQRFLLALPATEHEMNTLDAQPVLDAAVSGQTTVAVQVSGSVRFGNARLAKPFQQNFLLTADAQATWKVATECFRCQD